MFRIKQEPALIYVKDGGSDQQVGNRDGEKSKEHLVSFCILKTSASQLLLNTEEMLFDLLQDSSRFGMYSYYT